MSKASLKLAVKPAAALEIVDDLAMGQQLTALFNDANDGFRRVLRFGAAFLQIESSVTAVTIKSAGGGMKGWLEKYAPEVARSTAYKYRDITEAVALKFKIENPSLCFEAETLTLAPAEQAKRDKAIDFVAGKSLNAVQLELGLKDAPKPKIVVAQAQLTPEQEHEEFIKAARARAVSAFAELHDIEDRWQLLDDAQLDLAIKNATAFAKIAKAWLETPPLKRAVFDVEKHLKANADEQE